MIRKFKVKYWTEFAVFGEDDPKEFHIDIDINSDSPMEQLKAIGPAALAIIEQLGYSFRVDMVRDAKSLTDQGWGMEDDD